MDIRCDFFQRERGCVPWPASEQQLMDAAAGTSGALPHFSQITWQFDGFTSRGSQRLLVDGSTYFVGHGDPGRASDGE